MGKFQLSQGGATYEIDAPDETAAVAALAQATAVATPAASDAGPAPVAAAAPPATGGGLLQGIREAIHAPTRILENGILLGLGDRARAGMGAIVGDGDYGSNLKKEQGETEQFHADHPIAAPALDLVGSSLAPVSAFGAAGKGVSLGAKTLYAALAGGGLGGVQGGFGSKDWTDVPQTAKDVAMGTGVGFALGWTLPGAAKIVGTGIERVANAVRGRAEGMSRDATGHLVSAVEADTPAAIRGQLDRLGPDAMLADTGPAMLGTAQGTSLLSNDARSTLQNAIGNRNTGTNDRIMTDVNRALGPAEDPQTVTNAIRAHRSAVDAVHYPAALDNAPEVRTAHILTQLEDMIPRSVGMEQRALTNLRDMMMTTERRPLLDSAGYPQYDNMGRQRFTELPVSQNDASVLHKVKGELDNVIEYDAPGLGVPAAALTRQQGALKLMRGEVNDALEHQVPGYREANAASAALARRGEAVDLGTKYLGGGKTTASPGRFADEFSRLEPGEQIAFAKGSRGNIERALGTKANDLQALRTELQGEGGWNTAKIAAVHGQDAADDLVSTVDRNLKFRDTHNKVVENSQTAQRLAAKEALKPTPASETPLLNPNSTLTGMGATIAKKGALAVVNALTRSDPTRSYGEIANILSAQGPQRDQYFQAIVDAMGRRTQNAAAGGVGGDKGALATAIIANAMMRDRRQTQQQ